MNEHVQVGKQHKNIRVREYYDSVCFLSDVFTSTCVRKFDISRNVKIFQPIEK